MKYEDVEDWPVMQDALELARLSEEVAKRIARVRPELAKQIRKSADSVVLNLREGATEYSPKEKARIYRVSQKESGELIGAFRLLEVLKLAGDDSRAAAVLARRIIGQLTGLCHAALKRLAEEELETEPPTDPRP
ncbi:MAG TPA: four helix bundle protein [Longimicrobiales bacterium]